jgi:hypothetical protein
MAAKNITGTDVPHRTTLNKQRRLRAFASSGRSKKDNVQN